MQLTVGFSFCLVEGGYWWDCGPFNGRDGSGVFGKEEADSKVRLEVESVVWRMRREEERFWKGDFLGRMFEEMWDLSEDMYCPR